MDLRWRPCGGDQGTRKGPDLSGPLTHKQSHEDVTCRQPPRWKQAHGLAQCQRSHLPLRVCLSG